MPNSNIDIGFLPGQDPLKPLSTQVKNQLIPILFNPEAQIDLKLLISKGYRRKHLTNLVKETLLEHYFTDLDFEHLQERITEANLKLEPITELGFDLSMCKKIVEYVFIDELNAYAKAFLGKHSNLESVLEIGPTGLIFSAADAGVKVIELLARTNLEQLSKNLDLAEFTKLFCNGYKKVVATMAAMNIDQLNPDTIEFTLSENDQKALRRLRKYLVERISNIPAETVLDKFKTILEERLVSNPERDFGSRWNEGFIDDVRKIIDRLEKNKLPLDELLRSILTTSRMYFEQQVTEADYNETIRGSRISLFELVNELVSDGGGQLVGEELESAIANARIYNPRIIAEGNDGLEFDRQMYLETLAGRIPERPDTPTTGCPALTADIVSSNQKTPELNEFLSKLFSSTKGDRSLNPILLTMFIVYQSIRLNWEHIKEKGFI